MSEDVPDRMFENMPDRMSDYMRDRMKDVRKCADRMPERKKICQIRSYSRNLRRYAR